MPHNGLMFVSIIHTDPADPTKEAAALDELVSNGANLMNTVDCLLNYINTLNEVTSKYGRQSLKSTCILNSKFILISLYSHISTSLEIILIKNCTVLA